MWAKEKDSRFLSIIGCLEISSICCLQRVVIKLKSIDLALSISDIRKCGTE